MRQFDFAPLYRSTVGFDRLAQLLDSVGGFDSEGYPPYNIERLAVSGHKQPEAKDRVFLHRGIAARAFERRFQLADHVEVSGADYNDGLLHIDLVRNVPERLKPRTVSIGTGSKQIEATA